MGLDLRLLPVECTMKDNTYSHTILSCERRYKLFSWIRDLPVIESPGVLWSFLSRDDKYDDSHYGETREDPYGDPIKCTTAKELKTLADHEDVTDNFTNRAIWSYLAELPDDMPVALFWH